MKREQDRCHLRGPRRESFSIRVNPRKAFDGQTEFRSTKTSLGNPECTGCGDLRNTAGKASEEQVQLMLRRLLSIASSSRDPGKAIRRISGVFPEDLRGLFG